MEINIRQDSPSGIVVYTETQRPITNANGLVNIEIGGGAGLAQLIGQLDLILLKQKQTWQAAQTTPYQEQANF
jgi:hypothetical protein